MRHHRQPKPRKRMPYDQRSVERSEHKSHFIPLLIAAAVLLLLYGMSRQ
jgi:hypothetical protein